MKFNISFHSLSEAKKKETRVVTIEAPDDMLAAEWADRQAKHWGKPDLDFDVAPFVEESREEQEIKEELVTE